VADSRGCLFNECQTPPKGPQYPSDIQLPRINWPTEENSLDKSVQTMWTAVKLYMLFNAFKAFFVLILKAVTAPMDLRMCGACRLNSNAE